MIISKSLTYHDDQSARFLEIASDDLPFLLINSFIFPNLVQTVFFFITRYHVFNPMNEIESLKIVY